MVDITALIKEAGIEEDDTFEGSSQYAVDDDSMKAFAKVVAERCAKTAESGEWKLTKTGHGIAAAIRSLFSEE